MILNLLEMKTNKTCIQEKVNKEFHKTMTKKDIHNLAKKLSNPDDDTLVAAINILENDYGKFEIFFIEYSVIKIIIATS